MDEYQAAKSILGTSDTPSPQDEYQAAASILGTPQDVTSAQQQLGSDKYHNLCEKFVEQATYNKTGLFDSASTAWNSYVQNGKARQGIKGIKPGDILYWYNPNDSDGHASIYKG